jgi:hypothetical protein
MKKSIRSSIGRNVLAACLGVVGVASVAHAQTGVGRIQGTWDISLTVRNCATGQPLATISELATFGRDGTMISSTAGLPQATKTPGHGVWSHVSGLAYAYAFKFFRFDASTGGLIGWTVIRQEAVVDPSGDTYTAEGGAEVYNTAGTLVARGCSTTSASRFQ